MLKDSDIDIEFVKPILYDVYEQQKLAEVKMAIYKLFADQDEIHSNAWDCKKCAYYLVNYLAQGIDSKRGSQRPF
jgi:hypothetical protein